MASGQSATIAEQKKRRRAEATADSFIKRFHETLDFGIAFDELAVPDAIQRLRKTGEIKSFGMTKELAERIDDKTAARFYKASMNFYLLKSIFVAGVKEDYEVIPLDREMEKVIENSKRLRFIVPDTLVQNYAPSVQDFQLLHTSRAW
jgi:hypothetical protein